MPGWRETWYPCPFRAPEQSGWISPKPGLFYIL